MSCKPECPEPRGAQCHCGACHQTFSGLGLFDQHQDVNYTQRPAVRCYAPRYLGLVQNAEGVWHTREGLKHADSLTTRLAKARSDRTQK